jgi:transposase
VALRAQALLMMADGVAAADVAVVLGVHERTVFRWRKRFACENPSARLADAPRSGRPPSSGPKSCPPSSQQVVSDPAN